MSTTAPSPSPCLAGAMLRRLHPVAGMIGLACIVVFWTASLTVELIGDPAAIAAVKRGILWGLLLLIPALAMTGASGFRLAGGARSGPIGAKRRRMPIIALNGLLVLVPCAVALDHLAQAGRFGTPFLTLQAIELAAGAVNIALMGLNVRDGRRLVRGD